MNGKLHIFNPEHEMVLAHGGPLPTLPHNVAALRMNMGYLPALWANDGDWVLVDEVDYAAKALERTVLLHAIVRLASIDDIRDKVFSKSDVWGWDPGVLAMLLNAKCWVGQRPSKATLEAIRRLSSRETAAGLLQHIRTAVSADLAPLLCGESRLATSWAEVERMAMEHGDVVVKALWSSSGRGLRWLSPRPAATPNDKPQVADHSQRGWVERAIRQQGGVMVEPRYNNVMDLAMEFVSQRHGGVRYCGLSLFGTDKGAYLGNLISTESHKRSIISSYLPLSVLDAAQEAIAAYLTPLLSKLYYGPLGVDMMIVAHGGTLRLHPCVEINLRRTMGHAALAIGAKQLPRYDRQDGGAQPDLWMTIVRDPNFRLKLSLAEHDYVKVM